MTEDEPRRSISLSFKAFTNCDERAITSAVNFIVTLKNSTLDFNYFFFLKEKRKKEKKGWDLATSKSLQKNPKDLKDLCQTWSVGVSLWRSSRVGGKEEEKEEKLKKNWRKKKKKKKKIITKKKFFLFFLFPPSFIQSSR